jgi:SSS family solute:Na+ symporter
MFTALIKAKPGYLTMPGGTANLTHSWFISTILVNSLFFTWPHFFGSMFTAKDGDTVRRNSVIMPLYVIPLVLIIFAGCAAILICPGLANGDLALLTAVRKTFPPWLLGVVGGAGALTAMVPAAIQILSASTLLAKNVYRPFFAPGISDEGIGSVARVAVGVITVVALYLSLNSSVTLVGLLILAYSGVTQFAPGIVLGICSRRVTGKGVLAGLLTGIAVAGYLTFTHRDPFLGLNAGFVGLVFNLLVLAAVSSLTAREPNGFEPPGEVARTPS